MGKPDVNKPVNIIKNILVGTEAEITERQKKRIIKVLNDYVAEVQNSK